MLQISGRAVCPGGRGMSRRTFIRVGTLGLTGLALADFLKLKAHGQVAEGKAKSVILLFMVGGASHLDTFDPKPEAGEKYCGPLKNPIPTNVSGIRISELLPLLAKQADKYTILRGFTHQDFGHETAGYTVCTGALPGGDLPQPSMGAVVALKKGYEAGYKGTLPPYVMLTSPIGWFSDTGFLPQQYQAFCTFGDPNDKNFRVQGFAPAGGITDQRLAERRSLLGAIDSLAREIDSEPAFQAVDTYHQKAYEMVLGDAKKAFDLGQEKEEVRERYGRNFFGQCCLLARRLVEHGVPFVTINHGGWDTHTDNFGAMKNLAPVLDQGFATLLEDLAQRGLLQTTMVVWLTEFGRTPVVDWNPPWQGGRHHYPLVYSVVVAGGGFKGGQVLGSSDDKGEYPKDCPVYPWDLTGSIYTLLGIDPHGRLPHPQGCVAYVNPPALNAPSGGLLREIM